MKAATIALILMPGFLVLILGLLDLLGSPIAASIESGLAGLLGPGMGVRGMELALYVLPAACFYIASLAILAEWRSRMADTRGRKIADFCMGIIVAVCVETPVVEFLRLGASAKMIGAGTLQIGIAFATFIMVRRYQFLDPTPAMAAEEIFNSVEDVGIVFDRKGKPRMQNGAALRILGADLESGGPHPLLEAGAPAEAMRGILSGKEVFRRLDVAVTNPDGDRILLRAGIAAIRDSWRDLVGFIVVARPIEMLDELRRRFGLSAREEEVYLLLVSGSSNQDIADRLFIAPGTVKNHIHNIYEKTGALNRVDLALLLGG
jgi:DNA-binding CsgD family transcriptional regulator